MKAIFLILLLTANLWASSQSKSVENIELTSKVIAEISREWKNDSLGRNGYRLQIFKRLRYSKPDNISKTNLFEALGKPYQTSRFYSGNTKKNYVGYHYVFLCFSEFAKEEGCVGSYIEFIFDESGAKLLEIGDGDYCI